MNLSSVVGIASTGLDSIGRQLAVVSQNVANASTPGYARERQEISAEVAGGAGIGVRIGLTVRSMDVALQTEGFAASAAATGQQVTADALSAIDAASGAPGSGRDLSALLGTVRDGFSALSGDPSSQTQQGAVIGQAGALAGGVTALAGVIGTARQAAQDNAVATVAQANAALKTVGALSVQIRGAASRGEGTAQLEDARDGALQTIANLTGARVFHQADGSVLALAGGLELPQDAATGPFALAPAMAGRAVGMAGPKLLLSGIDVTGQFATQHTGQLGANLALRDTILPGLQSSLDQFALNLATSFQAQGLTLFTDGAGAVPGTATGFSSAIEVSPAVRAAPTLVRDGSGPAGPAGNDAVITAVLGGVFATGPGTLAGQATELTANIAAQASQAAAGSKTGQAVATSLSARLASTTGVSVDAELADLVKLQSAYTANARVLAATSQLWTDLFAAVTGR